MLISGLKGLTLCCFRLQPPIESLEQAMGWGGRTLGLALIVNRKEIANCL